MNINWSGKNTIELELFFSTDVKRGLSRENYIRAKRKYGENIINSDILENQNFYGLKKRKANIRAMLSRSADILGIIYILSMVIIESAGIDIKIYIYLPFCIFLIASAFIFGQKSEERYAYLYKIARPKALVIRQNKRKQVFADTLVPGDVIILSAGDIVPADAKIVEAEKLSCLHVIERSEYNETVKQNKTYTVNKNAAYYPEFEPDVLYASDIIDSGRATAIITATGKNTKVAQNHNFLNKPEISESSDNPDKADSCVLQKRALKLSKYFFLLSVIFALILAVAGVIQSRDFGTVILTCLTAAAACFSEQLPVIADFAVTYGMRRLSDMGFIIKKPSVIDGINSMDALIASKADYNLSDTSNVFNIIEEPSVNNRVKLLREFKSKKYSPAVAISEFSEMPLLNETNLSFTSVTTETGILKNKASVITKNLSVSNILKAVKSSVLIYRNMLNILNFSSMIFISQYLLLFFAVILNGAYILSPFQMLWSGIGAGYVFTAAMCYGENNAKWNDLRQDMQNPDEFAQNMLKRGFMSGISVFFASVLSFLICFGLTESKFIWEYINSSSAVLKSAQTAAFITYISACVFITVYYITGFRILRNKFAVIGITANLLCVVLAAAIQPLRDYFGFGATDIKIAAMAVLIGLLPAAGMAFFGKRR